MSFEQFIGMEIRACLSYRRIKEPLTFWRSTHGQEVDFLIDDRVAIEIKSTQRVGQRDLRGLASLAEERRFKSLLLVSHDPVSLRQGPILSLPWETFLKKLWDGDLS